jgi:hypothetical protein
MKKEAGLENKKACSKKQHAFLFYGSWEYGLKSLTF